MTSLLAGALDALLDHSVLFSFDRSGFRRHSRAFRPEDVDVSLSSRVCLVTGANSGIGRATARALFARGAEVHLLCRDVLKGENAAREIERTTTTSDQGRLCVEPVDIADQASIRPFVSRLTASRVDVLVNNAGVLTSGRRVTRDGVELTTATNLLGPFLLTELLLPRLRLSPDARVVNVSSGGMYTQRLNVDALFNPPQPFDGVAAYARTKRALVVLTELFAEHCAKDPITFSSMHPGWADTPAVQTSLPRFWSVTRPILRTPEEGADTVIWLAASRSKVQNGLFWFDRASRETHILPWTRDKEEAAERERLWDECRRRTELTSERV